MTQDLDVPLYEGFYDIYYQATPEVVEYPIAYPQDKINLRFELTTNGCTVLVTSYAVSCLRVLRRLCPTIVDNILTRFDSETAEEMMNRSNHLPSSI